MRIAREHMKIPVKVLAEMISEKEGVISRVEQQKMVPPEPLRKKLEQALRIKLAEAAPSESSSYQGVRQGGGGDARRVRRPRWCPIAVDLGKLVYKRKIDLEELSGKTVAIDAYNVLYQFLSIIRQPDGTPLIGPSGEVTSHLSGLFYRSIDMLEKGIRPIYVFDGVPSSLKQRTIEARMNRKREALAEFEKAKEAGDMEMMRSKAMATTRVTKEIAESGRRLLELMGVGCIKAPSEGEAQASWMASSGLVYAAGSQDYDTMLFGAPRVVRNLTFSGRRKLPMKNIYVNVEPEMMELAEDP